MKKRRLGVILCVITLATVALAVGQRVTKKGLVGTPDAYAASLPISPNPSAAAKQAPPVPENVLYGVMFREIAAFKKKAAEKEKKGEDASEIRKYHKKRARLNDQQGDILDRIADETNRETAKLDAKAKKIIEAERARRPGGQLKAGEELPAPPEALKNLGQQRKQLILKARERLRLELGDAEFQRFEQFVKQDIGSRIKPIKPGEPGFSKKLPQEGDGPGK
jgi:hypothetical protein